MGKPGLPPLPGELLEFINAYLLVVYTAMILVIARYIARMAAGEERLRDVIGWPEFRFALAILLVAAGDCLIRGPVWWWRHVVNHGGDGSFIYSYGIYETTLGMMICIWGGVCAIRMMSPKRWKGWPWVATIIAGATFALYFTL